MDDLLPCHGRSLKSQQCAYSSSEQPGLSPLSLVQKALAKLYGCYEHLNTGRVGWALEDLTGGVADAFYLRDGVTSHLGGTLKQPQLQAPPAQRMRTARAAHAHGTRTACALSRAVRADGVALHRRR